MQSPNKNLFATNTTKFYRPRTPPAPRTRSPPFSRGGGSGNGSGGGGISVRKRKRSRTRTPFVFNPYLVLNSQRRSIPQPRSKARPVLRARGFRRSDLRMFTTPMPQQRWHNEDCRSERGEGISHMDEDYDNPRPSTSSAAFNLSDRIGNRVFRMPHTLGTSSATQSTLKMRSSSSSSWASASSTSVLSSASASTSDDSSRPLPDSCIWMPASCAGMNLPSCLDVSSNATGASIPTMSHTSTSNRKSAGRELCNSNSNSSNVNVNMPPVALTLTYPSPVRVGLEDEPSTSKEAITIGSVASSSVTCDSGSDKKGTSIGVNLRVTGQCSKGGREYMEDYFSVAYQETRGTAANLRNEADMKANEKDLEYAYFGIFDGHGGAEAALFAKEQLMLQIVGSAHFWSDDDEGIMRAIREGFISTQFAMWRENEQWQRTNNGHLSTAGTTASIAFLRREKMYIGHVGDSAIVLGYHQGSDRFWTAKQLTKDHKPDSAAEKFRMHHCGGSVILKSGVPRVVWNRPRDPKHRGPISRATPCDDIAFLAVARSLGDLWSFNSRYNEFVVSPDPDVMVLDIDPKAFKCLIFGTDGLWNAVSPQSAVDAVYASECVNNKLRRSLSNSSTSSRAPQSVNPSKVLVDMALNSWASKKTRADNISVITVLLYPNNEQIIVYNDSSSSREGTPDDQPEQRQAWYNCNVTPDYYNPKESYHDVAKRFTPPPAFVNHMNSFYSKSNENHMNSTCTDIFYNCYDDDDDDDDDDDFGDGEDYNYINRMMPNSFLHLNSGNYEEFGSTLFDTPESSHNSWEMRQFNRTGLSRTTITTTSGSATTTTTESLSSSSSSAMSYGAAAMASIATIADDETAASALASLTEYNDYQVMGEGRRSDSAAGDQRIGGGDVADIEVMEVCIDPLDVKSPDSSDNHSSSTSIATDDEGGCSFERFMHSDNAMDVADPTTSGYTFAESYNTLLNEQEARNNSNLSRSSTSSASSNSISSSSSSTSSSSSYVNGAAAGEAKGKGNGVSHDQYSSDHLLDEENDAANPGVGGVGVVSNNGGSGLSSPYCQTIDSNSLHEIIEEQQRYQQQEGYSLTKLETRREQQRNEYYVTTSESTSTSTTTLKNNSSSSPAFALVQGEWDNHQHPHHHQVQQQQQQQEQGQQEDHNMLELHSLLEQEQEEERRVALENMQLQKQNNHQHHEPHHQQQEHEHEQLHPLLHDHDYEQELKVHPTASSISSASLNLTNVSTTSDTSIDDVVDDVDDGNDHQQSRESSVRQTTSTDAAPAADFNGGGGSGAGGSGSGGGIIAKFQKLKRRFRNKPNENEAAMKITRSHQQQQELLKTKNKNFKNKIKHLKASTMRKLIHNKLKLFNVIQDATTTQPCGVVSDIDLSKLPTHESSNSKSKRNTNDNVDVPQVDGSSNDDGVENSIKKEEPNRRRHHLRSSTVNERTANEEQTERTLRMRNTLTKQQQDQQQQQQQIKKSTNNSNHKHSTKANEVKQNKFPSERLFSSVTPAPAVTSKQKQSFFLSNGLGQFRLRQRRQNKEEISPESRHAHKQSNGTPIASPSSSSSSSNSTSSSPSRSSLTAAAAAQTASGKQNFKMFSNLNCNGEGGSSSSLNLENERSMRRLNSNNKNNNKPSANIIGALPKDVAQLRRTHENGILKNIYGVTAQTPTTMSQIRNVNNTRNSSSTHCLDVAATMATATAAADDVAATAAIPPRTAATKRLVNDSSASDNQREVENMKRWKLRRNRRCPISQETTTTTTTTTEPEIGIAKRTRKTTAAAAEAAAQCHVVKPPTQNVENDIRKMLAKRSIPAPVPVPGPVPVPVPVPSSTSTPTTTLPKSTVTTRSTTKKSIIQKNP